MQVLAGSTGRRIYAVVQPSQLRSLRALIGGGALTPIALIDAAERARGRDDAMRASLRDVLTSGDVRREILALEPLLAEFDGIEIAAAALRLLEQQRPERPVQAAVAAVTPMQKLFLNIGEKDGVRAQEIVKMIATEAGIPGSQIGRIEVRDTHSIVEVAVAVAEMVVTKIASATVRGRKVQARVDKPRDDRERRPSGDRGGPRGGPGGRGGPPSRGGPGGARPARPGAGRSAGPRSFDRDSGGRGDSSRPTRPRPRRDDA
jgi:ATP-dependent RNA helicase DeaD